LRRRNEHLFWGDHRLGRHRAPPLPGCDGCFLAKLRGTVRRGKRPATPRTATAGMDKPPARPYNQGDRETGSTSYTTHAMPDHFSERVRRFTRRLEAVLFDAWQRMDEVRAERDLMAPSPDEVQVHSWPQHEADGTVRQIHVVHDEVCDVAMVYCNGELVRAVRGPAPRFWEVVRRRGLPERRDDAGWAALV
jgi:hypothetical protein